MSAAGWSSARPEERSGRPAKTRRSCTRLQGSQSEIENVYGQPMNGETAIDNRVTHQVDHQLFGRQNKKSYQSIDYRLNKTKFYISCQQKLVFNLTGHPPVDLVQLSLLLVEFAVFPPYYTIKLVDQWAIQHNFICEKAQLDITGRGVTGQLFAKSARLNHREWRVARLNRLG